MIVVLQRLVYLVILVTCLLTAEGFLPGCTRYEECVYQVPYCRDDYYSCLRRSCWCPDGMNCMLAGEVYMCVPVQDLIDKKRKERSQRANLDKMLN